MLIEAEAIPYEPAQLRGERLLVLAPHPDDEVIACGGLIALHLGEGRAVRVVVATDGAEAGSRELREAESQAGLARLGQGAELIFLRYPDRGLPDGAADRIREHLAGFRPDLILVPSPVEIHPDHLTLSRLFCELVQGDETLFAELAVARVAFYEVSSTLRPNAIVDITGVAETKYAAIGDHASQLELRDYTAYARGLNAYRAMTMPRETRFAEAYFVVDLPELRTTAFSELRRRVGAPRDLEILAAEARLPISVVVRTRDRPDLLREAVESIRATGYPCEIVVVNDGGALPELEEVRLIEHERPRGRSEAANAGLRAASNAYVAFLDDDDLYYPEHLAALAAAGAPVAAYSDAVSVSFEEGSREPQWRLRLFSQDFDRELLLIDNYVPLPTLLVPRDLALEVGGFDPAFDLFEDWDFLIRLSQRGDFRHVPRVTCEIRHFQGGSSVVLSSPEGTRRFRQAKLQVWKKHASLITQDVIADVFERQKRRTSETYSRLVETLGQNDFLRRETVRLEREKSGLIAQLGAQQHDLNGWMLRVRELEGARQTLDHLVREQQLRLEGLVLEAERRSRENDALRVATVETDDALERARVEIDRLAGLLDMIYRSRTWKLHTMVEKLKGRG